MLFFRPDCPLEATADRSHYITERLVPLMLHKCSDEFCCATFRRGTDFTYISSRGRRQKWRKGFKPRNNLIGRALFIFFVPWYASISASAVQQMTVYVTVLKGLDVTCWAPVLGWPARWAGGTLGNTCRESFYCVCCCSTMFVLFLPNNRSLSVRLAERRTQLFLFCLFLFCLWFCKGTSFCP